MGNNAIFQLSVVGFDSDEEISSIQAELQGLIYVVTGFSAIPVKVFKSSISKNRLFTAEFQREPPVALVMDDDPDEEAPPTYAGFDGAADEEVA